VFGFYEVFGEAVGEVDGDVCGGGGYYEEYTDGD
jgi:hypothetical protein